MTGPRERSAGRIALFLLPSLKLKHRDSTGRTVEESLHRFLLDSFGGYTAATGNIFGYWKDSEGKESYGEHKEYKVGLADDSHLTDLKRYIARLSSEMGEECIYFEYGKEAMFIYAAESR
jgi:hypothetical protein